MNTPEELRYSESHEWVKEEGENTVSIGITDFAQSELGDVVYLELPGVGTTLTRDDPFGTVESVKAVSDLVAPVNGEVVAVNDVLVESPEGVNGDPYGSWFVKIRLAAASEMQGLMSAEEYKAFVAES